MNERIDKLKDAVQTMHLCEAVHLESAPVVEMFGNKTVWEGVVEVFRLIGHVKAKRCYAWSYYNGKEMQFVTALEIPPVDSPQTAVRAVIASGNG